VRCSLEWALKQENQHTTTTLLYRCTGRIFEAEGKIHSLNAVGPFIKFQPSVARPLQRYLMTGKRTVDVMLHYQSTVSIQVDCFVIFRSL